MGFAIWVMAALTLFFVPPKVQRAHLQSLQDRCACRCAEIFGYSNLSAQTWIKGLLVKGETLELRHWFGSGVIVCAAPDDPDPSSRFQDLQDQITALANSLAGFN